MFVEASDMGASSQPLAASKRSEPANACFLSFDGYGRTRLLPEQPQNRPPRPKTGTAAPAAIPITAAGLSHKPRRSERAGPANKIEPRREIKQGEQAPAAEGHSHDARDQRPTAVKQPGSSRPALKSGAAS